MRESFEMVQAFMKAMRLPTNKRICAECAAISLNLTEPAQSLARIARGLEVVGTLLESKAGDSRCMRAHLIVEETSEVLAAMARKDECELADALADLLYVVIGTAATYDIPIWEVFEEVHRSNMTKTRTDARVRDKGLLYKPPDVQGAINRGRVNNDAVPNS